MASRSRGATIARAQRRDDPAPGVPVGAVPPPPKLRRRPLHLALGLLLVALGMVLAAWLATTLGNTRSVVAVREPVVRGQEITARNLTTVAIRPDPALKVVAAEQLQSIVGQRAQVDLPAGGLVVAGSYAPGTMPAPGQSLVGVWLAPGQLPGQPLKPGDVVRVVSTPKQDGARQPATPSEIRATVVSVQDAPDGHTLVTVTVAETVAPQLAGVVATGELALVLDAPSR